MKLYEISDKYVNALEDLQSMEWIEDDIVQNTLDGIKGEFQEKALNLASFIANLELEMESVEKVISRLSDKKRGLRCKIGWLKEYLKKEMLKVNLRKIQSPILNIRLQDNPEFVDIYDPEKIPDVYRRVTVTSEISKGAIKQALSAGEEIPGVRLCKETRVVIG